jgi:hypothetical protein
MVFNYVIGRSLNKKCKDKSKGFSKKSILIFGIVFNLSLLGYFKYTDFLIMSFKDIVKRISVKKYDKLTVFENSKDTNTTINGVENI